MALAPRSKITKLKCDQGKERMLEVGRICRIVWGEHYRKLVVLVNFIDQTRVLLDSGCGALSDHGRRSVPMRRIQTTKFRIPLTPGASSEEVCAAVKKFEVLEHYKKSVMGRRDSCIQRMERLNDYGRFKLHFLRLHFKKEVSGEIWKMRSAFTGKPVEQLKGNQVRRGAVRPSLRKLKGKYKRVTASKRAGKDRRKKRRLAMMGHNIGKLKAHARKVRGYKKIGGM